ncbi:hypothetical protein CO054_01515 [Candidatus Shapirobacteria bacterium CG_4_9_14_0_2_um_filter_39_11]|uniref:Uncharacterized protein n=1 Tax=Candidatus Shapirobacteria bacterium CG_4_9_14_0_2_um_filter_39_11 TaxID=1974478 RepID=A0A2M8ESS0_9BACT|nr:MAG: hypothetical protein CO054_01515 [Candidatus Shapirobacteria bacterium CG_4_9_14_0_2_um_filter_39_11]
MGPGQILPLNIRSIISQLLAEKLPNIKTSKRVYSSQAMKPGQQLWGHGWGGIWSLTSTTFINIALHPWPPFLFKFSNFCYTNTKIYAIPAGVAEPACAGRLVDKNVLCVCN